MRTLEAFALGQANQGREQMVFDWDKAAALILRAEVAEAAAGLAGDWEWTGGPIFAEGKPVAKDDTYVFLSSTWATPELEIGDETIPCFRMASEVPEGWGEDYAHIYWPESALRILRGGE